MKVLFKNKTFHFHMNYFMGFLELFDDFFFRYLNIQTTFKPLLNVKSFYLLRPFYYTLLSIVIVTLFH